MFIKSILLQNFRNYLKKEFRFSDRTTLVVGPNASGKTNLLEAIYLLATTKSFRADLEGEMIGYGKELSAISCFTFAPLSGATMDRQLSDERKLEIILTIGEVIGRKVARKICRVNGVNKRQADFIGNLRAVYFGPEDLELITDSPSTRRKYLDMVLSQVDREYARAQLSYEKGVRARNKVLEAIREVGAPRAQLYFWNQLLIKNGELITKKREELIQFFNNQQLAPLRPAFGGTSEGQAISKFASRNFLEMQQFLLEYDKSAISVQRLEQYKEEEVAAGATLVGPHRDDIKFKVKSEKPARQASPAGKGLALSGRLGEAGRLKVERDLSAYGSRGEQRLAILWLKLCELAFIKEKSGEKPVLLLDDIFSELDEKNREMVWGIVGNQQTIISTADIEQIDRVWWDNLKIIDLGN